GCACLQAIGQGRRLDHGEVLARHPEFADELAEFFAGRAELHQLAGPLRQVALEARGWPTIDRDETADEDDRLDSSLSEAPARSFGDYELLAVIGRGGHGGGYKAPRPSPPRGGGLKMIPARPLGAGTRTHRA